jgi:hypothetical protein
MNSSPEDGAEAGATVAAESLAGADLALLLSLRAWAEPPVAGVPARDVTSDCATGLLRRLETTWSRRLSGLWDSGRWWGDEPGGAAAALVQLRRIHHATARVDFARVHPSWWVRALSEESPSVRRLVAGSAPEFLRQRVSDGLLLDEFDLTRDHSVGPEVLLWTMTLWSERLVGGEPERADDPPAIIVLSRLSHRAGYALCRYAGLGKLLLAGRGSDQEPLPGVGQARVDWFAERLSAAGPEIRAQSRRDIKSSARARVPSRHKSAWLGAVTLARLLADCEPFRVRWALQHWPYTIAKLLRTLMPPAPKRVAALSQGESLILKTAWDRLNLEDRLPSCWPTPQQDWR